MTVAKKPDQASRTQVEAIHDTVLRFCSKVMELESKVNSNKLLMQSMDKKLELLMKQYPVTISRKQELELETVTIHE